MSERKGGCLGIMIGIAVIGWLFYLFIVYVVPLIIKAMVIVVAATAAVGVIIGGGVALWAYISSFGDNVLMGRRSGWHG